MPISVVRFTAGPLDTNSFLAMDSEWGVAIMVDAPWGVTSRVVAEIQSRTLRVVYLIITHAHWDHVSDASALRDAAQTVVAAHPLERPQLEAPAETLYEVPFEIPAVHPSVLLEDGDVLDIGALHFHLLHTPGHSPGSICLYEPDQQLLFSGDTLFHNGYGRTDLPGGSEEEMWKSLVRLSGLPPQLHLFPGHGPESTLGEEDWLTRIPTEL